MILLVLAYTGCPGKKLLNVCVCVCVLSSAFTWWAKRCIFSICISETAPDKTHTHTHTPLTFVQDYWGEPVLKQQTVSGSGISWAICKSAPRSRQTTTPAPPPLSLLQAGCPSGHPANRVKALKAKIKQKSKCSRNTPDHECKSSAGKQ